MFALGDSTKAQTPFHGSKSQQDERRRELTKQFYGKSSSTSSQFLNAERLKQKEKYLTPHNPKQQKSWWKIICIYPPTPIPYIQYYLCLPISHESNLGLFSTSPRSRLLLSFVETTIYFRAVKMCKLFTTISAKYTFSDSAVTLLQFVPARKLYLNQVNRLLTDRLAQLPKHFSKQYLMPSPDNHFKVTRTNRIQIKTHNISVLTKIGSFLRNPHLLPNLQGHQYMQLISFQMSKIAIIPHYRKPLS